MTDLVFCLMGPTAANKTALAFELCELFPFEIISVDSAMIYRDMNIGTAKPCIEELERFPHHLVNILDPIQRYSAADFCEDALAAIKSIQERNKWPLLVGGTMLYYNALQYGLSLLPKSDDLVRQKIAEELERDGLSALHTKLQAIDPASALRIHPHDSQRIQRALEVYYISGKPLSFFLASSAPQASEHRFVNFKLIPDDRSWLHARIATRFDKMLQEGLIAEVEHLVQTWKIDITHPSMRSVGYRQVLDFMAGSSNYEQLREKGVAATRQLAKRQLTWLRSWSQAHSIACDNKDKALKEIVALIDKIRDNG